MVCIVTMELPIRFFSVTGGRFIGQLSRVQKP